MVVAGAVDRRVLVASLVRTVVIEVADVLVENGAGVSLVVDQYPVGIRCGRYRRTCEVQKFGYGC